MDNGYNQFNFNNNFNITPQEKMIKQIKKRGLGVSITLISMQIVSTLAMLVSMVVSFALGFANIKNVEAIDTLYITDIPLYYLQYGFLYLCMMVLPFVVLSLCFKLKSNDIFYHAPFKKQKEGASRGKYIIILTLMGFAISLLINFPVNFYLGSLSSIGIGQSNVEFVMGDTLLGHIIYCVIISILPAFAEEFAFRGVIFQMFKPFGNTFAIVSSALLFGIMHSTFTQIPFAFVLGLFFGYVLVKTKSIWICVLLHFLNNFTSAILGILQENVSENIFAIVNYSVFILCVVLFIVSIIMLCKIDKNAFTVAKTEQESVLTEGKKQKALFVNPGMICYLVLAFVLTILATTFGF